MQEILVNNPNNAARRDELLNAAPMLAKQAVIQVLTEVKDFLLSHSQ